jgi:hypothetical protein
MAEVGLASSIIGIVSAGTKVSLVLLQLASDVGTASNEARIIASDIKAFVVVIKTLVSTLEEIQESDYYANCTNRIKEMTDACLEMFTEMLNTAEEVRKITQPSDRKYDIIWRLQWALYQKPRMADLRRALEAHKSTLALMLGTLDAAEKVARKMYGDFRLVFEQANVE